ncbi:ROK family protein [Phycicoccus sp. Soil748]|uniref:ROK family protein n=1 Tax=Phycicoccus sp. Soil748 TaxID=1736397 RepID=UPI000A666D95|nr:ROK family protein [Phycicoccus sp. Soil748]
MTATATTSPAVLAVDLGGSAMKGAVVDGAGRELATRTVPTPDQDVVAGLTRLLGDLSGLAADARATPVGAGVVTPGSVDEERGVVRYASNLRWRDLPLRDLLGEATDLPVAVGHDVRAAGVAEQLFGAGRGSDSFVLVPLGTGVAAAVVVDGRVVTGFTGAAGEFGHIPLVPDGETCPCGQRGCLEAYASAGALTRRYAAREGRVLTAEQVVAALGSDPTADRLWDEAVTVLAQGLDVLTILLDPQVIVLGGGLSRAGATLLEPLTAKMDDGLAWRDRPPVVLTELGDRAGRLGAAVLAFRAAGRSDLDQP